jgi:predicted neutral ceramidase superfamily lipid hydrolase
MSAEVQSAARAVAHAQAAAELAAKALATASAERAKVECCIAEIDTKKAGIATQRRNGVDDPAHGGELAVLDLDRATLVDILAGHNGPVARATAAHGEARQSVVFAEQRLAAASDVELQNRLVEHAKQLDALLLETVNDLAAVGKRRGGRAVWGPSPGLINELTKLHLNPGLAARR